jgi:ABC-type sugar transport system ATPase subunit
MTPSLLLSIEHVSKSFGGLQALSDVCLAIHAGEIYGLMAQVKPLFSML